jgi:hypothetical protein
MKKHAALIASVVLGLVTLLVAPLATADDANKAAAGAYMFKFTGVQQFFGPGTYVPGFATLSSDGTLTSVTGSDEAGPAGLFSVKNSAVNGVWFRTGHQSVGARALYLNFSPITGEVVSITRLRIVADFDKDFNNGVGQFFNSIYVCPTFVTCPDPLTTAPTIPEPAVGQPFTLTRIR